jgi:hypothetical protein
MYELSLPQPKAKILALKTIREEASDFSNNESLRMRMRQYNAC